MFLLILESLGSTELLFILVMALVFFGPRKLPQLSRKLGKSMAEFRRASEDFKSTWEREVAMENPRVESPISPTSEDRSLFSSEDSNEPMIHPVSPEENIPREANRPSGFDDPIAQADNTSIESKPTEPPQKRDWL